MDETMQAPKVTWTRMNHKYVEGEHELGYAVCTLCGATENSAEICEPCPKGPVGDGTASIAESVTRCLREMGVAAIVNKPLPKMVDGLIDDYLQLREDLSRSHVVAVDALHSIEALIWRDEDEAGQLSDVLRIVNETKKKLHIA
jgi:hypothetical protein